MFLATAFEPAETAHDGPEEAHMTIERWPLDDAIAAANGRITDSKTQIGILAAARDSADGEDGDGLRRRRRYRFRRL